MKVSGTSQYYKTNYTTEEMNQMVHDKVEDMTEKMKRGDMEQSYAIGSQSFTKKEWDKLLEKFDAAENVIKKQIRESIEKQKEKKLREEELNKLREKELIFERVDEQNNIQNDWVVEAMLSESTITTMPAPTDGQEEGTYITWYTKEGIQCRKAGETEKNQWSILFTKPEQYEKVLEYIKGIEDKTETGFAAKKSFWTDFLENK